MKFPYPLESIRRGNSQEFWYGICNDPYDGVLAEFRSPDEYR